METEHPVYTAEQETRSDFVIAIVIAIG